MLKETIALSQPIMEWVGFKVRVSIETPGGEVYHQMYLSDKMLETLRHYHHPIELEQLSGIDLEIAFLKWTQKREIAEKMLASISGQLAVAIAEGVANATK